MFSCAMRQNLGFLEEFICIICKCDYSVFCEALIIRNLIVGVLRVIIG